MGQCEIYRPCSLYLLHFRFQVDMEYAARTGAGEDDDDRILTVFQRVALRQVVCVVQSQSPSNPVRRRPDPVSECVSVCVCVCATPGT